MRIRSKVKNPKATTDELCKAVSFFIKNIDDFPKEKITQDFYLVNSQVLIDILSNDARTKPLARLLQDLQGQIGYIIGYTKKDIDNCISTTKDWITNILISTPEPFFSRFFSKPSLNSFMKSVSLWLMAHINNRIPPIGLYELIQEILKKNRYFFSPNTYTKLTKEEIANQLLLYYYYDPENLKNYLNSLFSKKKYYPTAEEVDSKTGWEWIQACKDYFFWISFDEELKNKIFQEVEKQKKKYDHALQCTQKYQHTIQEFFSESTQQNKFVAFKTCMSILKAQNQVFKDFSLDQFTKELKEMYSESSTDFKKFLKQYFYENVAFYDQDLIDKTYQMIKKIKEEEDLEIELNCRIDYMKYNNNIVSDMKNEEIKQALFQISQKDQTEKQDQKENTEKLPGVLVELIPNTPDKNDYINETSQLIKFLSNKPSQQAA